MPIRLCQKCGLKVLIDDSQSATNPFYCQRCTTAMKGSTGDSEGLAAYAAAAPPKPKTSVPAPAPVPAAAAKTPSPVASGARPATVKVLCPYCKASFNGRVPAKPARGSCPVCQKELVLLPDGDIRPAAGFDLAAWQAGKEAPAPASAASAPDRANSTEALVQKYAADPPPAPEPEAEAEPEPERAEVAPEEASVAAADTDTGSEPPALPSWLDESGGTKKKSTAKPAPQPVPETDVEIDIVQPGAKAAPDREATRLEDLAPPPAPEPRKRPAPRPAPTPAASSQSTAARPAVQSPVLAPPPAAPSASGLRKPVPARTTDRKANPTPAAAAAEAPAEGKAPTGTGLALLALVLVLIPVAGMLVMLGGREKLGAQEAVVQVGKRLSKGLAALLAKLAAEPARAPEPEPPKPAETKPEEPAQPTAEDRQRDEEEINKLWMEFKREDRTFKQKSVGASAAEKAEYQSVEEGLKKKSARIEELKGRYRKLYGKSYDPRDQ